MYIVQQGVKLLLYWGLGVSQCNTTKCTAGCKAPFVLGTWGVREGDVAAAWLQTPSHSSCVSIDINVWIKHNSNFVLFWWYFTPSFFTSHVILLDAPINYVVHTNVNTDGALKLTLCGWNSNCIKCVAMTCGIGFGGMADYQKSTHWQYIFWNNCTFKWNKAQ